MKDVTLYGKGAITLHNGKTVIRSANGCISVPEAQVAQVMAMGFTRAPTGEETIDDHEVGVLTDDNATRIGTGNNPVNAVAPTSLEARTALYRSEAEKAGYTEEAVVAIIAERLRYDELIAAGVPEDEAVREVWPSSAST